MSTTNSVQVYENANKGLSTLTNVWEIMLKIIRSVSSASGSSLTVEPDLLALAKLRKEFETLMNSLRSIASWLENNTLLNTQKPESSEWVQLQKENESAVKEADAITEQLKQLLDKSYALQLQMEILLVSSQEISLN